MNDNYARHKEYKRTERKQIVIDMNKQDFDQIDNYCKLAGIGKATLIKRLIFDYMENHPIEDE